MAMTFAEQRFLQEIREFEQDLIQQWREHGIQILPDVERRAREHGHHIGMRMALLRQLRFLFGRQVDGDPERRVACASVEQVERWADRILSAGTLAEIFAD
jgi:hypothetical protein